jgi:predicted transcriptional regulator
MELGKMRTHDRHRVRETSVESYLMLEQMGEMQRKVYQCILENSRRGIYLTDREIANELGYQDPNAVRPRRFELMEAGLIKEAGKRECSITHRLALTWMAAEVEPILSFEGNKVVQKKYVSREDWERLRDALSKRGYRYAGNGTWVIE